MSTYASPYVNPLLAGLSNNGIDPLLGGTLGTGPTGLSTSLAGQIGGIPTTSLPYASNIGSLMTGPAGARGLPQIGPGAGAVNTLRPLASSMAPMAAEGRLAAQLGSASRGLGFGLAPGMSKLAAAGRIGGYGLLGQAGSNLIDATNIGGQNSNVEQTLQGVAAGAGIGAGVGSVVPVIGTGLGALGGGLIGGTVGLLGNIFGGGGDAEDPREDAENILATAITQANIDPDTAAKILDTYEIQLTLASSIEDEAQRDAAVQGALDQAGQMILQAVQSREAVAQATDPVQLLALQQQAQQVFQPLAQDIRSGATAYANAMGGLRDQLPESYRAIADATVAREVSAADRLANAYMAQAAITPVARRLTQYQSDLQNVAAQTLSQALAAQAAGSSGTSADLTALLQP